jgi:hypothetical protein
MQDRHAISHQQLAFSSFHPHSTPVSFSFSFIAFAASFVVLLFATSIVASSQHSIAAAADVGLAYPSSLRSESSDGAGAVGGNKSSLSPGRLSRELSPLLSSCPRLCHCRPSAAAKTAVDNNHQHHSSLSGLRASCGMNNMTSLIDVAAPARPPLNHEHRHPTNKDSHPSTVNSSSITVTTATTTTAIVYADIVELDVSHNHISELPDNAFDAFPRLRLIDVSANAINHVEPGAFSAVHSTLLSLRMDANPLFVLPHAVFWRLKQLTSLSLSRCLIGQLWPSLFRDTNQLTLLDLSSNRIDSLTEHTFPFTLPHLVRLSLADNPLRFIHPSSFRSFPSLVTLDLSRVFITVFPGNSLLRHAPALTFVDLSQNSLQSLRLHGRKETVSAGGSSSSLAGTTSLLLLTLYNTTIDCRSCSNVDALLYDETVSVEGGPTCSSPDSVVGLPVISLLTSRTWTCIAMAFDSDPDLTSPLSPIDAHTGDVDLISSSSSQIANGDEVLIGESIDVKLAYEPKFEYSPMTGWYTAAFLGGMLVFTTVYLAIGNVRRHYRHKREAAERRATITAANTTVTSASATSTGFPASEHSAHLADGAVATNGDADYELNVFTTTVEADADADDEGGNDDDDADDNYVELCHEVQPPNGGSRIIASSKCRGNTTNCNSSHKHHVTLVPVNGGTGTVVKTYEDGEDANVMAMYNCEYDDEEGESGDEDSDVVFPMILGADGELYRIVEIHPECPLHAIYLEQSSPSSSPSDDEEGDDNDIITVQVHHHGKQESVSSSAPPVSNSVVIATAQVEQHHNNVNRPTSVTPVKPMSVVTHVTTSANCHRHPTTANLATSDDVDDVTYVDNSQ